MPLPGKERIIERSGESVKVGELSLVTLCDVTSFHPHFRDRHFCFQHLKKRDIYYFGEHLNGDDIPNCGFVSVFLEEWRAAPMCDRRDMAICEIKGENIEGTIYRNSGQDKVFKLLKLLYLRYIIFYYFIIS